MLWFFEKQDASLHYEIRQQSDGYAFELVITHPDGTQAIERYEDAEALVERSERLHDDLTAAGWKPPVPIRTAVRSAPSR